VEITDVRVYPVRDEKVRAFVSIVFDRCFMINDIKVIQGKDGLFVSMPSRKRKSGEFKDVAHPLNSETRKWVEERILGAYRANLEGFVPGEEPLAASPSPQPAVLAVAAKGVGERSLEEVERLQFGDSFWGLT
jgi:stage V sporulation protein G